MASTRHKNEAYQRLPINAFNGLMKH